MTTRPLPPSCYAALAALKAQAQAVTATLIEAAPRAGMGANLSPLGQAQLAMAANEPWTSRIARALMANMEGVTIDTADDAWLERVFDGYDESAPFSQLAQGLGMADERHCLEQLDVSRPLALEARHNTGFMSDLVEGLHVPLQVAGAEAQTFLAWAGSTGWRRQFERDLQCIAQDEEGQPLLTTWMPLDTFREQFCRQGLAQQDPAIPALMQRLLDATASWAAAGANEVDLSGYWTNPN
ncbi:hypothetical protein [Aquitalea palustris]|uniref:hypothetical protein n=1 Tax=Aquitalea palustris TaxID=2480983 RepID=UPI001CF0CEE1|nr:hypothetical protein [Aquitalea palustris]